MAQIGEGAGVFYVTCPVCGDPRGQANYGVIEYLGGSTRRELASFACRNECWLVRRSRYTITEVLG